jgi:hypothetical protein
MASGEPIPETGCGTNPNPYWNLPEVWNDDDTLPPEVDYWNRFTLGEYQRDFVAYDLIYRLLPWVGGFAGCCIGLGFWIPRYNYEIWIVGTIALVFSLYHWSHTSIQFRNILGLYRHGFRYRHGEYTYQDFRWDMIDWVSIRRQRACWWNLWRTSYWVTITGYWGHQIQLRPSFFSQLSSEDRQRLIAIFEELEQSSEEPNADETWH